MMRDPSHRAAPTSDALAYVVRCESGRWYVSYDPVVLGSPNDHQAGKWYFRLFPVPPGVALGEPFGSATEAERAAHLWDAMWGN